jgi:hypothetical protein
MIGADGECWGENVDLAWLMLHVLMQVDVIEGVMFSPIREC